MDFPLKEDGEKLYGEEVRKLRRDVLTMAGQYLIATGSSNAFTIQLDSNEDTGVVGEKIASILAGHKFAFKANHTITGTATLTVKNNAGTNLLTNVAIKKNGSFALNGGDIINGQILECRYDGTNIQLLSNISIGFGDGSDGDFLATTNTTLNPSYKIFQYNDFTVNSGVTLTFGSNFLAKPIIVLVNGNLSLNGATVDVSSMGYAGGSGGTQNNTNSSTGTAGSAGSHSQSQLTRTGGNGGLGGGGTATNGAGLANSGSAGPGEIFGTDLFQYLLAGYKFVMIGSGGGGGGAGGLGQNATGGFGGAGGVGGRGGGGILFLVRGNINVTNAVLKANGANGSNGSNGGNSGNPNGGGGAGGGGGGGGGGSFRIGYLGAKTGNPTTLTATGGNGGSGGTGGSGSGGAGTGPGAGGSGGAGAQSTTSTVSSTGSNGAGTGGSNGGAGGAGSTGGDGITEIVKLLPNQLPW